jgi:hypothetical protein
MLTSTLSAPRAHAAPTPAEAIVANVGSTVITSPPFDTNLTLTNATAQVGYTFWAYVDVINVQGLWTYGVGFTFDNTSLNVIQTQNGGFFPTTQFFLNSSADNAHGILPAVGGTDANPAGHSGSGHLIKVEFNVTKPFSDGSPGHEVFLMNFTTELSSLAQTSLVYNDTATDITPAYPSGFYNGYFTLTIVPEFSQVFFAFLLVSATLAVALFGSITRSRKRKN